MARELSALGLEVHTGIAGTGVVGLLEGDQPGPVLLVRVDMDALPIQEQNQTEYVSQNPGVMHACGHDGHTAIGLTAARLLMTHRQDLKGAIKFVFQPAEEGGGGAERMVIEGILANPRPEMTLSIHVWNDQPLGWLGISAGPIMAAAEIFRVNISGRGGHGAAPHLALDPVLAAAQTITALQSVVSRNVPPLESAVISVATIHGGDAFNVIPSGVELGGTIRSFEPAIRAQVLERFQQVVRGICQSMSCQVEIEIKSITPAVINDPAITHHVQQVARRALPGTFIETSFRTMGSEDMAFMMQQVPGCYILIGSANPEKQLNYGHHHPRFDFDEQVLPRAAALLAASALDILQ